ncbi:MAG: metallophosphoesterase [bacterium]
MRKLYSTLGTLIIILSLFAATAAFAAGETDKPVFYFGVLSDAHTRPDPDDPHNKAFVKVLKAMGEHKPALDFIINLGDSVDQLFLPGRHGAEKYLGPDKKPIPILDLYNKTVRDNVKIPYYDVLGNHEFYWDVMWNPSIKRQKIEKIMLESRKEIGSMPGLYYSFDNGGFTIIALDSSSKATSHSDSWLGGFDNAQLDWLEAQLKRGRPAILFFHHYPATPVVTKLMKGGHMIPAADRIFKILEANKENVAAAIFGHGHHFIRDSIYGIPIYMAGSPGTAPGYTIVECKAPKSVSIFNEADIKYNESINRNEAGE